MYQKNRGHFAKFFDAIFPFRLNFSNVNDLGLVVTYENVKKVRYTIIVFSLSSFLFIANDIFRDTNHTFTNENLHVLSQIANYLSFGLIFFIPFFKHKTIEDHLNNFKVNNFLVFLLTTLTFILICILSYVELIMYKKESSIMMYMLCINFVLVMSRFQRLVVNFLIIVGYIIVIYLTHVAYTTSISDLLHFLGVQIVGFFLGSAQYKLWRSNYLNEELLKVSNEKLEMINNKLNNSKDKLEQSNTNLQNFVYAISHDLREPLRVSNNFASILLKSLSANNERDIEMLDQLKKNIGKMNIMLDDLLEFSNIGHQGKKEQIDLNIVLETIKSNLSDLVEKSNATINASKLPTLFATEGEMISLFQNLIANSMKYKSSDDSIISIDYKLKDNKHIITISDNGIGIPEEEMPKVFKIFYRATNTKEFKGTGIGLSICKKIMDRMSGDITIKRLEKGTQFVLIFPFK